MCTELSFSLVNCVCRITKKKPKNKYIYIQLIVHLSLMYLH